jgi:hypothetical protein
MCRKNFTRMVPSAANVVSRSTISRTACGLVAELPFEPAQGKREPRDRTRRFPRSSQARDPAANRVEGRRRRRADDVGQLTTRSVGGDKARELEVPLVVDGDASAWPTW